MNNKIKKSNKSNKLLSKSKKQSRTSGTNTITLNGPVNYFKLSNNKNQINIFMDFHAPITRQRKCADYDSKDIDKYFNKILSSNNTKSKSKTETLDFFLEINPTSISFKHKYYSNDNYLASIRKMFSKLYNEKYANLDEDKMPEQNIRLHYMDIRDYSSFNELKRKMEAISIELDRTRLDNLEFVVRELTSVKNILIFINGMIESITTEKKNPIYESLSTKKIDFINLREKTSMQSNKEITQKKSNANELNFGDTDSTDNTDNNEIKKDTKKGSNIIEQPSLNTNMVMDVGLYQILQKILLNYKNSNNQDNIINLFTQHYIKTSHYIINKLNTLISNIIKIDKVIDDYILEEKITFEEINSTKKNGSRDILPYYFYSMDKYKKVWREIIDEVEEINHLLVKMGVIMTDCHFLRRLIDNSTIKKSIVYTGAYHSTIYLWFLVKYCNYDINDYSYLRDDITKSKLVDVIKKSDYLDIMQYVIPNKVIQCVKIKEL